MRASVTNYAHQVRRRSRFLLNGAKVKVSYAAFVLMKLHDCIENGNDLGVGLGQDVSPDTTLYFCSHFSLYSNKSFKCSWLALTFSYSKVSQDLN